MPLNYSHQIVHLGDTQHVKLQKKEANTHIQLFGFRGLYNAQDD